MIRQALGIVLPLIAPTVLYVLWAWLRRHHNRRRRRPESPPPWLVLIGLGGLR